MKRLIIPLLCALLILPGCIAAAFSLTVPDDAAKQPCLIPVEATEDDLRLLDVLRDARKHDSVLFDFIAPEGAKYIAITQWELADGQWQICEGDNLALNAAAGRIALNWTWLYEEANVVLWEGESTFAVSHDTSPLPERTGEQMVTMLQSMEVPIALETEIPLMMEIITNQTASPVQPLSCWQDVARYAGHESVCLVTIRFSAEPLDANDPQHP